MNAGKAKQFSEALLALHECTSPAEIGSALLRSLGELMKADMHVVNWIGPHELFEVAAASGPYPLESTLEIFQAHFHEHPLRTVVERAWTHGQQAGRWSDMTTFRQFRRTALYQEFFRYMGTQNQIAVTFPVGSRAVVGLSYNRGRCNFSEAELRMLALLAPHAQQLIRNMMGLAEMQTALTLAEFAASHEALLIVNAEGNVHFATARAQRLLRDAFPQEATANLPQTLRAWLAKSPRSGERLEKIGFGGRLSVECAAHVPASAREHKGLHFFAEQTPKDLRLLRLAERKHPQSAPVLQRLGLTPRQAEVLFWMAQGKRSSEIALILEMSARTVDKHCENLFAKLGVETRGAAVAAAWETLASAGAEV